MKRIVTLLALVGSLGLMAAPASAKWGLKHNKQQNQSGQMGQSQQPSTFSEQPGMSEESSSIGAQPGQAGVSGKTEMTDVMSPKQHFLAARSSFDQGDFNACAQHVGP